MFRLDERGIAQRSTWTMPSHSHPKDWIREQEDRRDPRTESQDHAWRLNQVDHTSICWEPTIKWAIKVALKDGTAAYDIVLVPSRLAAYAMPPVAPIL
jgi:hypothetical protein